MGKRDKNTRKGRNTIQPVKYLFNKIINESTLQLWKGKYHTVFIHYTKAFDLTDRKWALERELDYLSIVMENMLKYNEVELDDGIIISKANKWRFTMRLHQQGTI